MSKKKQASVADLRKHLLCIRSCLKKFADKYETPGDAVMLKRLKMSQPAKIKKYKPETVDRKLREFVRDYGKIEKYYRPELIKATNVLDFLKAKEHLKKLGPKQLSGAINTDLLNINKQIQQADVSPEQKAILSKLRHSYLQNLENLSFWHDWGPVRGAITDLPKEFQELIAKMQKNSSQILPQTKSTVSSPITNPFAPGTLLGEVQSLKNVPLQNLKLLKPVKIKQGPGTQPNPPMPRKTITTTTTTTTKKKPVKQSLESSELIEELELEPLPNIMPQISSSHGSITDEPIFSNVINEQPLPEEILESYDPFDISIQPRIADISEVPAKLEEQVSIKQSSPVKNKLNKYTNEVKDLTSSEFNNFIRTKISVLKTPANKQIISKHLDNYFQQLPEKFYSNLEKLDTISKNPQLKRPKSKNYAKLRNQYNKLGTSIRPQIRKIVIMEKMLGSYNIRPYISGTKIRKYGLGLKGGCLNKSSKMKYCCHCGKKLPDVSCEVDYESY